MHLLRLFDRMRKYIPTSFWFALKLAVNDIHILILELA